MKFRVDGVPVGKQRHRLGRGGRMYTPSKTVEYESRVAEACLKQMKADDQLQYEKDVPLVIEVTAFFPIPKSWSKRKIEEAVMGRVPFLNKPDVDNVLKSVMDGVQGIIAEDDKQFTRCVVRKAYSTDPHTMVQIYAKEGWMCVL